MANKNLNAAKTAKKDEFYTQLTDIERELQHYWPHFRDKVVLCNCDDPYESNFFKYFALRFNQLGLKKLICTCYDGSPVMGTEPCHRDRSMTSKHVFVKAKRKKVTRIFCSIENNSYICAIETKKRRHARKVIDENAVFIVKRWKEYFVE